MNNNLSLSILHLLETPGVGTARVRAILDWASESKMELAEILSDDNILKKLLTENQIRDFLSNEDAVNAAWEQILESNISLLTFADNNYPVRLNSLLGKKAPPLLAVLGNQAILDRASVGFCGSRKASSKGLETAKDCAEQLALNGLNIVSGYAAGVDMTTHRAALECGGTTTIVLAEGISRFSVKQAIRDVWDWENIVVLSEFPPGVTWSVRNAMQRNKTICALSQAMILVEAGAKGGSIEAGRTCLNMGLPLFTPIYGENSDTTKGNQELLEQGAQPIYRSRQSERAKIGNVIEAIEETTEENGSGLPLFSRDRKLS